MSTSTTIGVRVPRDVHDRLDRLASTTGRSMTYYVRRLLEENLDRIEWEEGLLQRASDIRAGRRETVSLDDVERQLDVED